MQHRQPKQRQTAEAGVLLLDVTVTGRWYKVSKNPGLHFWYDMRLPRLKDARVVLQGERDFLNALNHMGYESHYKVLKDAGFSTLRNFAQNIEDARLVGIFPDMKRSKRRCRMPSWHSSLEHSS